MALAFEDSKNSLRAEIRYFAECQMLKHPEKYIGAALGIEFNRS